ncbi:MAG: selenium cofactor biosynthesis protein YqeC [Bacillota bacterium]
MESSPLSLARCLGLNQPAVIAVYGAGGKTTLLNRIAAELVEAGEKVVLTTTTRIFRPGDIPLLLEQDLHGTLKRLKEALCRHSTVALGAGLSTDGKIIGIDRFKTADLLRQSGAFILVEADGARNKPLKGYAAYEPVLPDACDLIVPVLGLSALREALTDETVHRAELFAATHQLKIGGQLTAAHLGHALRQMIDLGIKQAPRAKVAAVINQLDRIVQPVPLVQAFTAAAASHANLERMLFTAAREQAPVRFYFQLAQGVAIPPVSAVVLAAGAASRMGRDKLALEFDGKPILEHTLDQIAAAGISDITVVVKPGTGWPRRLALRAGCTVIENPAYTTGLASSLKKGLAAAADAAQAVFFTPGDLPLVQASVYCRLRESHRRNLDPVTCPVYQGIRGNPVLFDRRTWPLLMKIEGDAGGRQIFPLLSPGEIRHVETSDPAVLFDLDTPADYHRLLELHKHQLPRG